MARSFFYDEFSDQLMVSCKKEGDIIAGSVRLLNLIVDFTTDNRVVNVELIGASDYLESIDINPEILKKLTGAELVFKNIRNGYLIYFILKAENKVIRVPYNILAKNPVNVNIS